MIDLDKIISDTLSVFENNKDRLAQLESINADQYYKLHTGPLTPLDIKIDCDQFEKEIEQFSQHFYQWGTLTSSRLGLALVNRDGVLKPNDPINGSLYEWNASNPGVPLIETDFQTPTAVMSIESLKPLSVFNGCWSRSNILKWSIGCEFKPHIDTVLPAPWIRLWGTTNAESIILRFYQKDGTVNTVPVESGRIYLIDTTLVHDAVCLGPTAYQFFLSVLPSACQLHFAER
jgi:hypothetical protein